MTLHLTDGTAVAVDDGDFDVTEEGHCFFMSAGEPVVILSEYAVRLLDASQEVVATWG